MRALLAAALLLAAGCGNVRPCRDGTLFVTLRFGEVTAGADRLDLEVQVENGGVVPTRFTRAPGADRDTVEVYFPSGYPAGREVRLRAVAWREGTVVGSGEATGLADSPCAPLELTLP